jgi:hypothetical protein
MKRRNFVQSLFIAPAAPAVLAAQQTATKPTPQPNTPARQNPRQPHEIPKLEVIEADLTANTNQHFFNAEQFAALEKLGNVLMPPLKGNPGALDAHAPEFLDFLISVSPADRQKLYRTGLDGVNTHAKEQFHKPFSELDAAQVDAILRPLLVVRLWPEDMPADPLQNFIAQAHQDLRTATMNSREWAAAAAASGRRARRGFRGGVGYYWKPIDPVSEG